MIFSLPFIIGYVRTPNELALLEIFVLSNAGIIPQPKWGPSRPANKYSYQNILGRNSKLFTKKIARATLAGNRMMLF